MSSGDVGHFDDKGRLFIDGRDDEMIVSGGENVFPGEIEELLAGHEAIEEAAAVGVDDEQFGQRLKAFVVLRDGKQLTEDEVKDYVRDNLARYKAPREVVFVDELPRNPTGKVLKRELADRGGRVGVAEHGPPFLSLQAEIYLRGLAGETPSAADLAGRAGARGAALRRTDRGRLRVRRRRHRGHDARQPRRRSAAGGSCRGCSVTSSVRDLSTTVLGTDMPAPVALAPIGLADDRPSRRRARRRHGPPPPSGSR